MFDQITLLVGEHPVATSVTDVPKQTDALPALVVLPIAIVGASGIPTVIVLDADQSLVHWLITHFTR